MKMIDPEQIFSPREEQKLLQSVAALLEHNIPQPDISQCPSCLDLKNLASRQVGLAEATALVDHIATCPHCFKRYMEFRVKHKRRIGTLFGVAGLAAGILIAVAVLQPMRQHSIEPTPPATTVTKQPALPTPALTAVLDLSKLGLVRSDTSPGGPQANVGTLPNTKLDLSIHLPIGSEDGRYEVALLRKFGESVVSSSGNATLQNYVEVLAVEIDLSSVAPGNYSLAIRRVGSSWREYPIALVPKEAQ